MAYLASFPLTWSLAWGVWMLCALALTAFFAVASHCLPGRPLARLAVVLCAAGAAVDLFCDGVQMLVLPMVAAEGPGAAMLFRALERAAGVGGLVSANGLYGLATLALTWEMRRLPGARPALLLGIATFAGAMLMAYAGFTGNAWQAASFSTVTVACLCGWALAVARAVPVQGAGQARPAGSGTL
jgi:hypothetical protein